MVRVSARNKLNYRNNSYQINWNELGTMDIKTLPQVVEFKFIIVLVYEYVMFRQPNNKLIDLRILPVQLCESRTLFILSLNHDIDKKK